MKMTSVLLMSSLAGSLIGSLCAFADEATISVPTAVPVVVQLNVADQAFSVRDAALAARKLVAPTNTLRVRSIEARPSNIFDYLSPRGEKLEMTFSVLDYQGTEQGSWSVGYCDLNVEWFTRTVSIEDCTVHPFNGNQLGGATIHAPGSESIPYGTIVPPAPGR